MIAEVTEVLNAAPWKPWKYYDGQTSEQIKGMVNHVTEELVDIFFFLVGLMEVWDISNEQFEDMFLGKLAENYRRIENGYNLIA